MAFTHLHVHTEYSLLDGASRIGDLVSRAKELGMDSLAITDHGVMFGVIDFYKECKKQGIKPILGCEIYTAVRTMQDRDPVKDKKHGHLVLLAENDIGYHNLVKIVSKGFTDGFYYKPRVDKEVLEKYHDGIIALSACLAGRVQNRLVNRDYEGACEEALSMKSIFGEDNFFLELQDQGMEVESRINPDLVRMSEELNIPLVCTNDIHYVRKKDAAAHDVLLAIQTGAKVDDAKRMRFPNDQFYLKSEEEMRRIFAFAPEACDNTQRIAERCNVEITFGEYHLPEFLPPEGRTNEEYLRELCRSGLKARYGAVTEKLSKRLEYELSVIESMGYVEYFLIVWDFIRFAKDEDIVVGPGRGSAAGSLVAYCLRITDIDPIKYNLIFERFLNPERVSMPDIDIDFCIERRSEVIEYVKRKYGSDNVSQIITFGTLKARAAIRDVGRALDLSYGETDKVAKAVPTELKMTIDKALKTSPDLKAMYEADPKVRQVVDTSRALEGLPRHASTHAAGVVISKKPVNEYVPLYKADKGIATQFNMTTIEELGLLKMDFLGLRNLTVIRDTLEMIKNNYGVEIDFSKMSYDDPEVFKMISSGNTDGVFQLESSGMTSFMKSLEPTCFEDIVAGISLYRPGPMDSIPRYIENKKDPSKIEYVTEELAHILDVTYGCMVYQEQVMQIVRDLAGYSYGRSDLVRRAMSKKKTDVMMKEKEYFINGKLSDDGSVEIPGCIRKGIPVEAAEKIFADMESFAQYAFNKSHAAAYAVLAYETGYLKCHYPKEFMAALISSVMGDSKQVSKYIRNCREMGIEFLPPSVCCSTRKFNVIDGRIRFGLLSVKNVGANAIDNIVASRQRDGIPKDIFEFVRQIDTTVVNKKAIESLIRAGALDEFEGTRAAFLSIYEGLMDSVQKDDRNNIAGQISLFQTNSEVMNAGDAKKEVPDIAEFDQSILLPMEKEMLGIYISGHPLDDWRKVLEGICTINTSDLLTHESNVEEHGYNEVHNGSDVYDGMKVVMGGIITSEKVYMTKKNQRMAFITIEDFDGYIEVVVFPGVYEDVRELLEEDSVVVITGRLDMREGDDPKLIAGKVTSIRDAEKIYKNIEDSVKLRVPFDSRNSDIIETLNTILRKYPGDSVVRMYFADGKKLKTADNAGVEKSEALRAELENLLGSGNVKMSI